MEEMEKNFSEKKFWKKLGRYAVKIGHSAVYTALLLFYTLQKPELPKKAKVIIIATLGYFIFPFDFIPDIAVGIGYTDDISALGIALLQVAMYIDDDVKNKAKQKLSHWFGSNVSTSEIDKKIS